MRSINYKQQKTAVINNDQNATNEEKEAAIQQPATAVTDAKK